MTSTTKADLADEALEVISGLNVDDYCAEKSQEEELDFQSNTDTKEENQSDSFPELLGTGWNMLKFSRLTLNDTTGPRLTRMLKKIQSTFGPQEPSKTLLHDVTLREVRTNSDEELITFLEQLSDTLAFMVQVGAADIKKIRLDDLLFTKQSFEVFVNCFLRRFSKTLVSLSLHDLFYKRYEECRDSLPFLGDYLLQSHLSELYLTFFPSLNKRDPVPGTLFSIIGPSLSQIKSLRTLTIRSWAIGPAGGASIAQVIRQCPLLYSLNVTYLTEIDDEGAESIVQALTDVASSGKRLALKTLDLRGSSITRVDPFITLIQTKGVEIVELRLSGSLSIENSIAKPFGQALFSSNLHLTDVKLYSDNEKFICRNSDLFEFVKKEATRLLIKARVLRSLLSNPHSYMKTTAHLNDQDTFTTVASKEQQMSFWLPRELIKHVLYFVPERDVLSPSQINSIVSFAFHGWPLSEDTTLLYNEVIRNNPDEPAKSYYAVGTQHYFLLVTGCSSLTGPQWFRPDMIEWATQKFGSEDDLKYFSTIRG